MDMDTPQVRRAGRDLLSLALIDSRNCTLQRFAAHEAALDAPRAVGLNPALWELGHVGWFQEYWIGRNVERHLGPRADRSRPRLPSIEPQADQWYDSSHVPHETRWDLPLPDVEATKRYLVETLESTLDLLTRATQSDDGLYFFRLALFHEDMHAEAFAYMAQTRGLPVAGLEWPQPRPTRDPIGLPATRWRLGMEPEDGGFVFDNEKWAHEVQVREFEIDAQPVTWAQYAEFVEDGGYDEERWWSAEGWRWLQASGRRAPRHVEQIRHGVLMQRGGALVHVPVGTPAMHVNWHEANAWCRWAGRRLPTEAEWEVAAHKAASRGFRWGEVWEWTASRFEPYVGFEPDPYADYSQPWFGTHRVLRGASFATRRRLHHPKYRNFYLPERDDIFCGFRSCAW